MTLKSNWFGRFNLNDANKSTDGTASEPVTHDNDGGCLNGDGQEFCDSKKDTLTTLQLHITHRSHTGIIKTGTYKDVQNTK